MIFDEDFKEYKWFLTSSGKLVVGGKSAEQNDKLIKKIKKSGKEVFLMHTSHPGSPFCAIDCDLTKVSKKDLDECAIFCGCFSRAWKEERKSTEVHVFKSSDVSKSKSMKVGTWGVKKKVKDIKVELELVLAEQNEVLRAVPQKTVKKKDVLLKVCPGKTDKRKMLLKFQIELDEEFSNEEILSALPAGGVRICK